LSVNVLTLEEQQTLIKLENYFRSSEMSLYERIFNALIIAEHELNGHYFTSEHERLIIENFKLILNDLLIKISTSQ